MEPTQTNTLPEYDPACYLCPRNTRMGGAVNEDYQSTYSFNNDFAALLPPPLPNTPKPTHPLLAAEPVHGRCDVVTFHPRHDLTLARMKIEDIAKVIEEWKRIYEERSNEPGIQYVQIFEVC